MALPTIAAGAPGARPFTEVQRPDGARLAVYMDGPAEPDLVIVLSHGWQATSSIWDQVVRHLPNHRARIVRYDQRGHGASTPGRARPSIGLLGDDLKAVITATAPARVPVVVVGHSMGGMAVTALAAQYPHLIGSTVSAVVLAATTSGSLDTSAAGHPLSRRLVGISRHAMATVCIRAPRPATHVRQMIRPRPYPQPPIDLAAHWFRALMQHDVTGQLEALARIPVHLLVGEKDQLIPAAHALRLADEVSTARVRVVAGAGHRLPTQQPEAVLTALEEACRQTRAASRPRRGIWRRTRAAPA